MTDVRNAETFVEVAGASTSDLRNAETFVEVAGVSTATLRNSETFVEVAGASTATLQNAETFVEVAGAYSSTFRNAETFVEVLVSTFSLWFDIGSGGALVGGTATISILQTIPALGGCLVGGFGLDGSGYSDTGSGGCLAGGTGIDYCLIFETGSAGVIAGGDGQDSVITGNNIGGLIAGGDGLSNYLFRPIISGGAMVGLPQPLVTTVNVIYSITGSGGCLVGGTGLNASIDFISGSGGVLAAGSANVYAVYNPPIPPNNGGVDCGGTSTVSVPTPYIIGAGGVLAAGSAIDVVRFRISGLGGCIIGGNADVTVGSGLVYTEFGSGGVVCGGSAESNPPVMYVDYAMHGGVVVAGTSPSLRICIPKITGGALAGTAAAVTSFETRIPTGSALVGGTSIPAVPTPYEVGSGGIILGGSTIITRGNDIAPKEKTCIIKKSYRCRRKCEKGVRLKVGYVAGATVCVDNDKVKNLLTLYRNTYEPSENEIND